MGTWNLTATYNPNGNPQWTFNGVGPNHKTIKVGETNMNVVVTVAGEGVALYKPPSGGLYGPNSMIYIEGQPEQPDWMTNLAVVTTTPPTQFSFTDTDPSDSWGQNYHFLIGYTVNGGSVQYTPDPTIMNLEPSGGSGVYEHAHEAARV